MGYQGHGWDSTEGVSVGVWVSLAEYLIGAPILSQWHVPLHIHACFSPHPQALDGRGGAAPLERGLQERMGETQVQNMSAKSPLWELKDVVVSASMSLSVKDQEPVKWCP